MSNSLSKKMDATFLRWAAIGTCLYIIAFYLAPYSKTQDKVFYIGVVLPGLYWLATRAGTIMKQEEYRPLRVFILIVLLLSAPVLWHDSPDTLNGIRIQLKYTLMCLALAGCGMWLLVEKSVHESALSGLIVIAAIPAFATYVYNFFSGPTQGPIAAWGNLGSNPNETGIGFAVAALAIIHHTQQSNATGPRRATGLIAVAAFLGTIYFSDAKSAAAAFLAGSLVWWTWPRILPVLILAAPILLASVIFHESIADLVDQYGNRRHEIWSQIWGGLAANLWFGSGIPESVNIPIKALNGLEREIHSLYLALLRNGGLFSLLTFLALVVLVSFYAYKNPDPSKRFAISLLAFGLVVQVFEGVYPVKDPNSFWLYTWIPIITLIGRQISDYFWREGTSPDYHRTDSSGGPSPEINIVAIAMQHEHERRAHLMRLFQELNLTHYNILDGYLPPRDKIEAKKSGYDSELAKQHIDRELSFPEIGCFLSHRAAWSQAAQSQKPTLILEADAELNSDSIDIARKLSRCQEHWEMVMLNYQKCIASIWMRRRLSEQHCLAKFSNRRAYCLASYMVTPDGARKLLSHAGTFYLPADDFASGGYIDKDIELYAVYPRCAWLSDVVSLSTLDEPRQSSRDSERGASRDNTRRARRFELTIRNLIKSCRLPRKGL